MPQLLSFMEGLASAGVSQALEISSRAVCSVRLLAAWAQRINTVGATSFHLDGYTIEGYASVHVPALDATLTTARSGRRVFRLVIPQADVILPAACLGLKDIEAVELGQGNTALTVCAGAFNAMPDLTTVTIHPDLDIRLGGLAAEGTHGLLAAVLAGRSRVRSDTAVFGGCQQLQQVSISPRQLGACLGQFLFTMAVVDLAGTAVAGPTATVLLTTCFARLWVSPVLPTTGPDTLPATLRNAVPLAGNFVVKGTTAEGNTAEATPLLVALGMCSLYVEFG